MMPRRPKQWRGLGKTPSYRLAANVQIYRLLYIKQMHAYLIIMLIDVLAQMLIDVLVDKIVKFQPTGSKHWGGGNLNNFSQYVCASLIIRC